jgi:CheY-like chemotaxis protein
VAAQVRAWHGEAVSVIVISAAADGHRRAQAVGADGYLRKPFDVDALVSHVARSLSA